MAAGAGTMIGVFLIIIDLTPADSGLTALIANRVVNATLTTGLVVVLVRASPEGRQGCRVPRTRSCS